MRVFFAIEIPEAIEATIDSIIEQLKPHFPPYALRWVKPHCFHVTLQFLKELNPLHMPSLIAEVQQNIAKRPAFSVELGPLELFPTQNHPKLIALKVTPHDILATVADDIGKAMRAHDYLPETRPFRGHLTLGRFNYNTAKHPCNLPTMVLPDATQFTVKDIILFQTRHEVNAIRYHPLERISLA